MPVNLDLVTAKLQELKEAQEHVQEVETELKALIMGDDGPGDLSGIGRLSALRDATSMVNKIISLLESHPDRSFHFKEIYNTVGGGNEASVRSTIAKLINDRKIRRVTWGEYKALQNEERPKAKFSI